MAAYNFKETAVYKKSFSLAMKIFERSSRNVCANLAEAYRKKRYPAHFVSKLTDCDVENSETNVWIDFAYTCGYIDAEAKKELAILTEEIGKMLYHMINNPDKY